LKEAGAASEVVVVSCGVQACQETLRTAPSGSLAGPYFRCQAATFAAESRIAVFFVVSAGSNCVGALFHKASLGVFELHGSNPSAPPVSGSVKRCSAVAV
jgi:Electron transfer flavoprotein, beta subunit